MKEKADSPGVYIPPPVIYIAIYFAGWLLQKFLPIHSAFFKSHTIKITGLCFAVAAAAIGMAALIKFLHTRNTVVTHWPAKSLQTTGIYARTRNPMYLGLLFLYVGVTLYAGGWWHILLLPVLMKVMEMVVIEKEEKYLERAFGQQYLDYKRRVHRWL